MFLQLVRSFVVYNFVHELLLLMSFIWRKFEGRSKCAMSTVTAVIACHEKCFQPCMEDMNDSLVLCS